MLKQPLFMFSFWLFLAISVLHHAAIFFYFYWTIAWFDVLMHFLGGMGIASITLWFVFWSGYAQKKNFLPLALAFGVAIASSFIIGALWEVFEVKGGIISWPLERMDSFTDLFMDMLGGAAAFINSLRYRKYLLTNES